MPKKEALNIKILKIKDGPFTDLKQVDSLRIFEKGGSQNFDKRGLFSTDIFGRVGSEDRQGRLGVIKLKLTTLHPEAYRSISELNKFYIDIMDGNAYAVFDNETKTFIMSNPDDGDRGFEFFYKHFEEIDWKSNNSQHRNKKIEMLKKFSKEQFSVTNFPILPAGLRDYVVKDGKPSEDEINDLYRSLLRKSSILDNYSFRNVETNYALDPLRSSIQKTMMDVYVYLEKLIDGKYKFTTGKWAKRSITEGTMNVITPSSVQVKDTTAKFKLSYNDTTVGLFQYLKMIIPFVTYAVRTRFLNNVFEQYTNNAKLINPKTFKQEITAISNNTRNKWLSRDGINDIVNKLFNKKIMESSVIIEGKYLCLLYKKNDVVSIVYNIDTLPDDIKLKDLTPITYAELFYLSLADEIISKKFAGIASRYPTAGQGGVYPTKFYVRSTTSSLNVKLVEDLNHIDEYKPLYEYPNIGETFINTMSPHSTHIALAGADLKNL